MVHDLIGVQSHYLHTPLEDTCTCAQAWCKNTCQMHEMFHGRGNMLMSFRLGLHFGRDAWDPRCEAQRVATSWPRHTLGNASSAKVERRIACNCERRTALHRNPRHRHVLRPIHVLPCGCWAYHTCIDVNHARSHRIATAKANCVRRTSCSDLLASHPILDA